MDNTTTKYEVRISFIAVDSAFLEVAASSMEEAEAKVREALAQKAKETGIPYIYEGTDITIDGETHTLELFGYDQVEYFYDADADRCDVWSDGEVEEEVTDE